jgi:glycosyltransferase involved in cell wall biosynthesis
MAHILFITHWFPTEDNHVSGIFVREHARAVALFHRVSIIHVRGISQTALGIEKKIDEDLTIYRLSYPKPVIPKTGWLYRLRGTNRIFQELIRQNNRPEIIHANVYSSADLAYFLSRHYTCPAVLSEHASVYPRHLLTPAQLIYYRCFMNRLRLIMPVSRDLQGHMQAAGIRGPFEVVPNAVDTRHFYPASPQDRQPQKPVMILTVAMLQPIKGIDLLIDAFSILHARGIDCRLSIVGDGPERQHLQELADRLQVTSLVSFLGVRSRSEVAGLMHNADLFALSSLWENQPVALIEALACGLPVVAPAIGGIPEIVQPEAGALFEPGNVGDLSDKLESVIAHLDLFTPASSARYAAETFSLEAVGQKFAAVYQQILQDAKSPISERTL